MTITINQDYREGAKLQRVRASLERVELSLYTRDLSTGREANYDHNRHCNGFILELQRIY